MVQTYMVIYFIRPKSLYTYLVYFLFSPIMPSYFIFFYSLFLYNLSISNFFPYTYSDTVFVDILSLIFYLKLFRIS